MDSERQARIESLREVVELLSGIISREEGGQEELPVEAEPAPAADDELERALVSGA